VNSGGGGGLTKKTRGKQGRDVPRNKQAGMNYWRVGGGPLEKRKLLIVGKVQGGGKGYDE